MILDTSDRIEIEDLRPESTEEERPCPCYDTGLPLVPSIENPIVAIEL